MNRPIASLILVVMLISISTTGCSPAFPSSPDPSKSVLSPVPTTSTPEPIPDTAMISPTISSQIISIEKMRIGLELPDLPLSFVEKTRMINSASGSLEVDIYQDSDGRKYSVNPETNQVVEMDARTLLTKHGDFIPQSFSRESIKDRAMKYVQSVIPDFENLQTSWKYEEGAKGDVYFFSWYGEKMPGSMNRPFAQLGFHKNGLLFAYYNTLQLNK